MCCSSTESCCNMEIGYGQTSPVPEELRVIGIENSAQLMFIKANHPEAILSVAGDFDKEGLQEFKQMLLGDALADTDLTNARCQSSGELTATDRAVLSSLKTEDDHE